MKRKSRFCFSQITLVFRGRWWNRWNLHQGIYGIHFSVFQFNCNFMNRLYRIYFATIYFKFCTTFIACWGADHRYTTCLCVWESVSIHNLFSGALSNLPAEVKNHKFCKMVILNCSVRKSRKKHFFLICSFGGKGR